MRSWVGRMDNEIADLRRGAGLTQRALGEMSGINLRQIQKLESGEININNLTLKNAVALAAALGVPAERLIRDP